MTWGEGEEGASMPGASESLRKWERPQGSLAGYEPMGETFSTQSFAPRIKDRMNIKCFAESLAHNEG